MFSAAEIERPVPGQLTCGFEKTPAADVLARINPQALYLAREVGKIGSRLPGYVKLHSLALWQPGARESFLDQVQVFGETRAIEARLAVGSLSETFFDGRFIPARAGLQRAMRVRLEEYKDRLALYSEPIDPDRVEQAPKAWTELLLSLPSAQRTVVEQAVGTVDPSDYFLNSRTLVATIADFRSANPTAIDLGGRVLSANSTLTHLRENRFEPQLFRAVAFGQ